MYEAERLVLTCILKAAAVFRRRLIKRMKNIKLSKFQVWKSGFAI